MIINSLGKKAYAEIDKIITNYKEEVNKALEENGLNGMVVRTNDGAVGKLFLTYNCALTLNYELKFYPVMKSGEISKKSSGYVDSYKDIERQFTPYKGAK